MRGIRPRIWNLIWWKVVSKILYVEHIRSIDICRKLKAISIIVDTFDHLDRTNLLSLEFVVGMGRHTITSKNHPNKISHIKYETSTMGISRTFVVGDRSLQIRLCLSMCFSNGVDEGFSSTMKASTIRKRRKVWWPTWYNTINDVERTKSCASVKGTVVRKFRLRELGILRLDRRTNKTAQKITQRTIDDFCLAIGLRMVCRTHV